MRKVVIGIQARSTSSRLPKKSTMKISGRPLIDWVLKACKGSAKYINNFDGGNIFAKVCLLVPEGDPLQEIYGDSETVYTGPEHDVLSRYMVMVKNEAPDYVARITGDCPLIPHFLITKHIVNAVKYKYDYVSNVDEETRTYADGLDCEVISSALFKWANANAVNPSDREHVTTILRRQPPEWARSAYVVGYQDTSSLKLSVDTEEDLDFVRAYHEIMEKKINLAKSKPGGFFRI